MVRELASRRYNVVRVRFRPGGIRGMNLFLDLALLRGFFSGFSGFPPFTKINKGLRYVMLKIFRRDELTI